MNDSDYATATTEAERARAALYRQTASAVSVVAFVVLVTVPAFAVAAILAALR